MAQSESETVLTEHHETDNLDPRTDAPARPGTPVHIAPVQLGNITVPTPVVLSPMAGVTNWPFRVICEEYGPDGLYVAEMITARALVAHNPKALRLCHFAKSEKIRSLQLYGVNPSITEQAAKIVVDGNMADHVDLNFGCPVPKVTRRGGGSALPWKTDIFTELLQRVVAVCEPAGIPVTAKIRVGIDHNHETFLEAGHIAQEEGCKAVTLHARTTAEYYGGHSDWSRIGELKEHLNIPVFGNGDIWGAEDALEAIGISPSLLCDDYGQIFDRMADNAKPSKNSKEVVFALYNDQTESKTGGYSWYFAFPEAYVAKGYQGKPVPIYETQWLDYGEGFLAKLRDSRDNRGDTRVKYNLGEGDYGADGGRLTFCRKFLGDMSAGKMVLDADLIYYRAALAVMMDAELKYYRKDYGGALESLNIIAKRAYGKDDYYTDASQEAVLEALVDEYFLEFPAEGVIWWALIRLDKIWDYNDYLAANRNNTNILLWPISKSARDKNSNLTQTEGWY